MGKVGFKTKLVLVLAYAFAIFWFFALLAKFIQSMDAVFMGVVAVGIGLISAEFNILKNSNKDWRNATITDLIVIAIVVIVTRTIHYLTVGYTSYTQPLNILFAYGFYICAAEISTIVYLFLKDELYIPYIYT